MHEPPQDPEDDCPADLRPKASSYGETDSDSELRELRLVDHSFHEEEETPPSPQIWSEPSHASFSQIEDIGLESFFVSLNSHAFRPKNLPTKSEHEAERHWQAVRQAMESATQQKHQDLLAQLEVQEKLDHREDCQRALSYIWLTYLIPRWETSAAQRQLYWSHGLPSSVRSQVWPRAIGNKFRITKDLWNLSMEAAHEERARKTQVVQEITNDVCRTLPLTKFFQVGGPFHEDCILLLTAFAVYRPDLSYIQGMSFLAGMLLIYLPPFEAFLAFSNLLLTSPSLLGLYLDIQHVTLGRRFSIFMKLLNQFSPQLHDLLDQAEVLPETFLLEWFLCLYTKCLPLNLAALVWDLYLLEGEIMLYKAGVAIFLQVDPKIRGLERHDLIRQLRHLHDLEEKSFVATLQSLRVSEDIQQEIRELEQALIDAMQ